jgi:hypothetical protein
MTNIPSDGHRPTVILSGAVGTVHNVIALCKTAAASAGWSKTRIKTFTDDLLLCDNYDDVLSKIMDEFDVE